MTENQGFPKMPLKEAGFGVGGSVSVQLLLPYPDHSRDPAHVQVHQSHIPVFPHETLIGF